MIESRVRLCGRLSGFQHDINQCGQHSKNCTLRKIVRAKTGPQGTIGPC